MVDRILIDTLNFKAAELSGRWAGQIRASQQLKHYNELKDDMLVSMSEGVFPKLADFIEHGLNRSVLGDFFVKMGKISVEHGFPLSEAVYGLRLVQKVVLEYIEREFVLDDTVALYQALGVIPKVADFFVLGCFYLNKGFQESMIEKMSEVDKIPRSLLSKYFKDDFFFKKE